ncbi:MAG: TatD family hydrolase [Deltaproteobacteria bacterium]|nr:TatD family hydrolase [Deltaproteobacteria bacterium]
MKGITDTHCHLNDASLLGKIGSIIERSLNAGVHNFIVPAYDIESLEVTYKIANKYKNVYPAYGIHPWYINESFDLNNLRDYLADPRTIAVGEIGLDYADDVKIPRDLQMKVFISQVELAIEYNLPVLIHCRRAHLDMINALRPYGDRIKGVMHSYSGSKEMINDFLALNLYLSFSGAVTRTHAKKYHRSALFVPLDRILFETDAPSISTQTVAAKDVEPHHIWEIIDFVAGLRKMDKEILVRASMENVDRLFDGRIESG